MSNEHTTVRTTVQYANIFITCFFYYITDKRFQNSEEITTELGSVGTCASVSVGSPEIKNSFLKSKMNKDLADRLVPNGEYRDAKNLQISRSEGSSVGEFENIPGNQLMVNFVGQKQD